MSTAQPYPVAPIELDQNVVRKIAVAVDPLCESKPDSNQAAAIPPMDSLLGTSTAVATPDRAAEIAVMPKFGLREFIELTGVGVGEYGIYRITDKGMTLRSSADSLSGLLPSEQIMALGAEEKLSRTFPCSPEEFIEWYDATRGTNDISDLSLAPGFLETFTKSTDPLGDAVVSSKIVAAFRVESNPTENEKWWDDRMRGAKRYGLQCARALPGRAQIQSMWHPALVASWLIEKEHLNRGIVLKAMEENFPESDTSFL